MRKDLELEKIFKENKNLVQNCETQIYKNKNDTLQEQLRLEEQKKKELQTKCDNVERKLQLKETENVNLKKENNQLHEGIILRDEYYLELKSNPTVNNDSKPNIPQNETSKRVILNP